LIEQNSSLIKANEELNLALSELSLDEWNAGKSLIAEAINFLAEASGSNLVVYNTDSLSHMAAKLRTLNIISDDTVLTNDAPRPVNISKYVAMSGAWIKEIRDYAVTYIADRAFTRMDNIATEIDKIILPNATSSSTYAIGNSVKEVDFRNLRNVINLGSQATLTKANFLYANVSGKFPLAINNGSNLIHLEYGAALSSNVTIPNYFTTAYSKTSSSLIEDGEPFNNNNEKWNHNLREYFAKNLQDRTGFTTVYTITFGSTVLAQMEEETIEAFTSKNWTLA
jgi:hypothetical protein